MAEHNFITMDTLKELYDTLKKTRELGLPTNKEYLAAVDKLEEKIIKEEVLPALSQDLEPRLSEIKRDLVLVVEYHPGEPLSVALSRKVKIGEIDGAKTLTPEVSKPVSSDVKPLASQPHEPTKHIENPTKGLRVTFADGTVVWRSNAIATFIDALGKIGFERIPEVGIMHSGYNLVGKNKRKEEPGRIWQHEVDGWYVYSNISNEQKKNDLKLISDYFHLNLTIEEIKPK